MHAAANSLVVVQAKEEFGAIPWRLVALIVLELLELPPGVRAAQDSPYSCQTGALPDLEGRLFNVGASHTRLGR